MTTPNEVTAPSCGIKQGETMAQAAEGWAQWCEVRGNQMLANFLRSNIALPVEPVSIALPGGERPIDVNELERIAKERPKEYFLKGSGVLKLTGAIRQLERELRDRNKPTAQPVAGDAERLDWLQSQGEAYGFENYHEGNRWTIDGPFMFVRDAIDAAIAAGGKPTHNKQEGA